MYILQVVWLQYNFLLTLIIQWEEKRRAKGAIHIDIRHNSTPVVNSCQDYGAMVNDVVQ